MNEEVADQFGVEILDPKLRRGFAESLAAKRSRRRKVSR
jgi:hypothetical protein